MVMSNGNRVSFNYCFQFVELPMFESRLAHTGGIVDWGSRDVKANRITAATGSAKSLNSATGMMLPAALNAPPITATSFTLKHFSWSIAAANAMFVMGPITAVEMVLGGLSARSLSISLCAGSPEDLKSVQKGLMMSVLTGIPFSKGDFQVSSGLGSGNRLCTPCRPSIPSASTAMSFDLRKWSALSSVASSECVAPTATVGLQARSDSNPTQRPLSLHHSISLSST